MSLRIKTVLGIAIIEAILLLLLISMTLSYLKQTNYNSIEKRADSNISLFAATATDAVLSYDLASLDALVHQVLNNHDLVYARVLTAEGQILSQEGRMDHLSSGFIQDIDASKVTDGVFDTTFDITEGGIVYGRVELGLDTNLLQQVIDEAQQRSAIIAFAEMALVALFSLILGTYLTGQLKILVEAAMKVSAGDLNINVPIRGNDETASVARAFNTMVTNLKEANRLRDDKEKELQELNRTLEDRVLLRTQQLSEQNKLLESTNKKLTEAQQKLVHAEKMASIGHLSAGIAHEINNPLSFVTSNLKVLDEYTKNYRSYIQDYEKLNRPKDYSTHDDYHLQTQALREEYDLEYMNEDIDGLLSDTIDGATRVGNIVKGIKEYSHIDNDKTSQYFDINKCINSALNTTVAAQAESSLRVVKDLESTLIINGSSSRITLAISNILLNATQACSENGVVTVSSLDKGSEIVITVKDDGCGIPEKDLSSIFDPFFTSHEVGKGIGLGLTIAYGIIVEGHKGDIQVSSKQGKGSCFTITLPAIQNTKPSIS